MNKRVYAYVAKRASSLLLIALATVSGVVTSAAHAAWTATDIPGISVTPVGERPLGIFVYPPLNAAAVLNKEANTQWLIKLDTGDLAATAQFAIGVQPNAIALNPAGSELWVADDDGKRLLRFSVSQRRLLETIPLSFAPTAIAFNGDGSRLFVAADDRIRILSTTNRTLMATITLENITAIGFWPAGNRAVAVDSRNVYLINPVSAAVEATVPVGSGLVGLALDTARATAYVADAHTNAVAAVDLNARTYRGRYGLPDEPAGIAFDPLNTRVLVTLRKLGQLARLDPVVAALQPSLFLGEKLTAVAVDNTADRAVALAYQDKAFVINLLDKTSVPVALPAKPTAIGIDEPRRLALIGLNKGQGLRFLDLTAAALLPDVVAFDSQPRAIAVDSARGLAVVVVKRKNQVLLVDLSTRQLTATLAIPGEFHDVAIHRTTGLAYLVNQAKGTGEVVILNLATRAVTGTVAVAKDAESIVIDEALDLAVVAIEDKNQLQVIDLKTNAITATHTLTKHPRRMALNPMTHTVVVTAKDSDQIALLDLTAQTLTPNFAALDKPLAVAATTRYNQVLVIAAEKGEITFIQLPNPVPVLTEIVPPDVTAPSPAVALLAIGKNFIDAAPGCAPAAATGCTGSKVYLDNNPLTTRWKDTEHLEADVPPDVLKTAGIYRVKIINPAPGGGESQTRDFTVQNPVPVLTAISPTELIAGPTNRTLTVTGSRFVPTAVVRAGTLDLATTYVDATRLTAILPGSATANPGTLPITVYNPIPGGGSSNAISLTVLPAGPKVDSITPNQGEPGTLITLTGSGFDPIAPQNQVVFAGNVTATVQTATTTELKLTVPPGAITGPIQVTTNKGTTQSPSFTVKLPEDFQLLASPATVTLIQNAQNSFAVQLTSTGTQIFTSLVKLAAQGLPTGVSAQFSPSAITANQTVKLTLSATGTATPTTFTFTVTGTATLNGRETTRTATATVSLQQAGQTGVKGRFIDPNGNGIAGVYVRYETLETTSDAAGNFLLLGLPAGKVTLRMDATPANPQFPIWPSTVETYAEQVTVLPDWPLIPPPPIEQLKPINNATQDQQITDERYPGLAITLPKGVTITGWDGVVKDKIAVERLDPDKLGVANPPILTKSVYQLYFGTPMGGIPSSPIPVTLPNDVDLEPGDKTELWYFDGSPMGGEGTWKKAGTATVSADGRTVSSDAGSGVPRFCGKCGLLCIAGAQDKDPNPKSCPTKTDDPVILSLGMEAPDETDIYISGRTPIRFGRSYSPYDAFKGIAGVQTSLGVGWVSEYDVSLFPINSQLIRIVLPGNARIHFTLQADGSFANQGEAIFQGAVINTTSTGHELRFKNGQKWIFTAFPGTVGVEFLTEKRDPSGGKTLIGRSNDGKIVLLQNDSGRGLTIAYGSNGYISKINDALGRTVEYTYQATNYGPVLASVKDIAGGITQYKYGKQVEAIDDPGRITWPSGPPPGCFVSVPSQPPLPIGEIHYPGQTTPLKNLYDTSGRVLKQIQPDGTEINFAYHVIGACVARRDNHVVCRGGIDSSPGITPRSCPTADSWATREAGYYLTGGTVIATTVTDANGNATTYRFNPNGQPTEFVDALGQTIKYVRNVATNRVTQEVDALGRVTRYVYDTNGNVIRIIEPENRVTDYEYDLAWNQVSRVIQYKQDGTPVPVLENTFAATTGLITAVKDANNNGLTYTYTPKGQLKTITDALGKTTTLDYNSAGDLTAITDPLGNTRDIDYDLVGRSLKLTDALGQSTALAYNNRDQVTQVTDALKSVMSLEYDPRGNLTKVTNPNQQAIASYAYNDVDQLLRRTDGNNKTESYTYDPAGNLKTYTDRKGQVTAFSYDPNDRLTEIAYADGTKKTYIYDAAGRLTTVSDPSGTISFTYDALDRIVQETSVHGWTRYSYDTFGRRTKLETPHQVVNYTYDDAGNLTKITQGTEVTDIAYDKNNRRTSLTYPNGIVATYTYDDANRLTAITYRKGTAVIESLSYVYDPSGQVIQRNRTAGAAKQESAKNATYDPKTNRLLSHNNESFTYDANGNLTARTTSCGTTAYTWDTRDRLIQIAGYHDDCSVLNAGFKYDALGRRTETTVNGQSTTYLYDGSDVIAELGQTSATYLRTDNIDEAIARYSNTGNRYYLTEILGSTQALTDSQGNTTTTYQYSPYGETDKTGTDTNPAQYTGRENDQTGLYYYRARYYAPQLSRFISEDPIGLAGGLNVYQYVESSPTNYTDPSGTIPLALPALAYMRCLAECQALNALADTAGGALCDLKDDNCFASCANPLNWFKFGKYAKVLKMAQNNKQLRKRIESLKERVKEHQDKIKNNPDSRDVNHWQKEINAWQQTIDRLLKRLP